MSYEIVLQDFDVNAPANTGRPCYFNVDMYLSVIEQMISSDEVERALWMLDNMPGWYRDNPPPQVKRIREHLLKKMFTTIDYALYGSHYQETKNLIELTKKEINDLIMLGLTRANIIYLMVRNMNAVGIEPHIEELAPGSFWLPIGLKKNDFKFTYHTKSLNQSQEGLVKGYLGDNWSDVSKSSANIFVCFELIEHLAYEAEIFQHYLKADIIFSHILLSTPKYSIFGGNADWSQADLGHLRTYTPNEFTKFAFKHWPEFKWVMYDGGVMILQGERSV